MKNSILIFLLIIIMGCSHKDDDMPNPTMNKTSYEEALDWAQNENKVVSSSDQMDDLSDLSIFDPIIGNARIVSLGESDHGLYEQTIFRVRLMAYLVQEKGFTHFVAESGLMESRIVDQYINGDPRFSNYEDIKDGFTHNMGNFKEMKVLIDWMKAYNDNPANNGKPKLHYIGVDEPVTGTSIYYPLVQLREYLEKVDSEFVTSLEFVEAMELASKSNRVFELAEEFFLSLTGSKKIDPDFLDSVCGFSYRELNSDEMTALKTNVDLIKNRIESEKGNYISMSNESDYNWYLQISDLCQQIIRTQELRLANPYNPFDAQVAGALGLSYTPPADEEANPVKYYQEFFDARVGREQTMFDNMNWILDQSSENKVFFTAHNGHLQKRTIETEIGNSLPVGSLLDQHHADNYVVIAATMNYLVDDGRNIIMMDEWGNVVPEVDDNLNCVENILSQADPNEKDGTILLFDLQTAPEWFEDTQREIRFQFPFRSMSMTTNFDAILYFAYVKRAETL